MKAMYRYLLINMLIVILGSIVFIVIYQNNAPKNTEDYIFNQVITLEDKTIIESVPSLASYQIIYASYVAKHRSEIIGTVYEVHIKNGYVYDSEKGYGSMKAYVGIDQNDKIFVEIFEIDQTSIYRKNILKFVEDSLQEITLTQLEKVRALDAAFDLNTGATATDSTSTLLALIIKTAQIHFDTFVDDPWIEYFGEDYVSTLDASWDTPLIKKYDVTDFGFVFEVSGSGPYEGYDGTYTGAITIQVITDETYTIQAIRLVSDVYGHTLGFAKNNTLYLNGFVDNNLLNLGEYLTQTDDLRTGATGSKELLESIMKTLIEEVLSRE